MRLKGREKNISSVSVCDVVVLSINWTLANQFLIQPQIKVDISIVVIVSALMPRNICRNAKRDFSKYNSRPRYCYWPLKILFCCPRHVNLTIGHSPINIRIFNNIQSPPSPFAVAVSNVCWPQTGGDQSSSGVPPPFPHIVPLVPPWCPFPWWGRQ